MPTRSDPAVKMSGTIAFFRNNTVTGPGSNSFRIPKYALSTYATSCNISNEETARESGWDKALIFILYTFLTASSDNASAPNPYNVSVG